MNADADQLIQAPEVGQKIASSILEYCSNPKNREIIARLKNHGLQFEISEEHQLKKESDKLAGLTIVITGSFEKHSRDDYKKMIEAHGGKNGSGITKKQGNLLAGGEAGPSKLEKATSLGVKLLNEDDFLAMISSNHILLILYPTLL